VSRTSKLKGRTFLITRTVEGNRIEREKLETNGAKVIELPLIVIGPPSNSAKIDDATRKIQQFDWIVFTSANGVKYFFSKFKAWQKEEIKAKFACVGSETQRELEAQGLKPSIVPSEFLTLKLGEALARLGMKNKRILLARAEEANPEIASLLRNAGAIVVEAPVYRTIPRKIANLKKEEILERVTDLTLTSPSTVRGLITNFSAEELKKRNIRIHCIGPVTAKSAEQADLQLASIARVHTIDGLIDGVLLLSNLP
jgi:uroporphyrinogen-III synthase